MNQAEKSLETLLDRINSILDYLIAKFPEDRDELKTNKISVVKVEKQ